MITMKTCETLMHGHGTPVSLPDLTLELWSDILSRLPVKDLLKLRCINKLLCSIIDSTYFISTDLKYSNKNNNINNNLLVIEKRLNINHQIEFMLSVTSLNFDQQSELLKTCDSLNILGNCKKLMLITNSCLYKGSDNMLWLWNPSIRKRLFVPWCPLRRNHRDDFVKFLLGFSPSEDDFKLVAFRFNQGRAMDVSVAVYCLRNHGWKSEIKRLSMMFLCFSKHQIRPYIVFSQGVAYWMAYDEDIEEPFDIYSVISMTHLVCFDFEIEDLSFVELPDAGDRQVSRRFIFLLGESVAVLSVSSESSCIWVLGKDGGFVKEPWRVWPSTEPNLMNCKLIKGYRYVKQRIFYDQDSDTFFMHTNKMVISYNITTHQFQRLVKRSGRLVVEPYVESLILHKGTAGQTLTSFP